MKRLIACVCVAAAMAASAELKLGTVNLETLIKNHPSHESNRTLVKSTADDYRTKMEARQVQAKALMEEAKKIHSDSQNPMLSASAKAEAQKKLDGMQQKVNAARQDLIRSEQSYRETMNDLETRLLKMETSDIRAKIAAYAKEKKLDLVIDSTMAAYAADALDVTDDILRAMKVDPAKRKALMGKGKEKKSEGK